MSASIDGTAIDQVLRDAVDSGGVPHVAAIAADRDGVIYQGAAGPRAVGESDPVTVDTLFRIMSMTKLPATVTALQQVEQGHLDLDAPVADYCPEFAEIQVLTGFDGDTPQLRPPARPATVKNLITHTSGLGYWFFSDLLIQWEKVTGVPNVVAGSNASFTASKARAMRAPNIGSLNSLRAMPSPCSPLCEPLYWRTRSKHSSAIERIRVTSVGSFMLRTGRTCRQPTDAWAYQVPRAPWRSKTAFNRSV